MSSLLPQVQSQKIQLPSRVVDYFIIVGGVHVNNSSNATNNNANNISRIEENDGQHYHNDNLADINANPIGIHSERRLTSKPLSAAATSSSILQAGVLSRYPSTDHV